MLTKQMLKTAKAYERQTPKADQAKATFQGKSAAPNAYHFLPLLGYVLQKKLVLQGLVLKTYEPTNVGTLDWIIPLNERTFEDALCILASLGWDGRVWPEDPGWPDGHAKEAEGLRVMLTQMGLSASFAFPPQEKGSRVLTLNVLKTNGEAFPLPLALKDDEKLVPTVEMRNKLHIVAAQNHPRARPSSVENDRLIVGRAVGAIVAASRSK